MNNQILKITNLTKEYGKIIALNNVNLTVNRGEICAIIGKRSSGKTSLVKILSTLYLKSSGDIEVFGEKYDKNKKLLIKKIGFVIEDSNLNLEKTAYENINISRLLKGIADKSCIKQNLQLVGLEKGIRGRKVKKLPLGIRRKISIAKALIGDVELLILDSPLNGLNSEEIIEIKDILVKLKNELGLTILIVNDNIGQLESIIDRFQILNKGKIIETFKKEEIKDKCRKYIKIRVNNIEKSKEILSCIKEVEKFNVINDKEIKVYSNLEDIVLINRRLIQEGIDVEQTSKYVEEVDTYVERITGGDSNEQFIKNGNI